MKKGYWVVACCSFSDESALKEYGKLAVAAIEAGYRTGADRDSRIVEGAKSFGHVHQHGISTVQS
jgi:hypothetical protein